MRLLRVNEMVCRCCLLRIQALHVNRFTEHAETFGADHCLTVYAQRKVMRIEDYFRHRACLRATTANSTPPRTTNAPVFGCAASSNKSIMRLAYDF